MFLDIIILVPFTIFQIYDIILCNHDHMPLHCLQKRKKKENQKKRNIKLRKIDEK